MFHNEKWGGKGCVKLMFYKERRGGKESNSNKEESARYITLVIITKKAEIKEVQSLQSISDYYSMFQNIL